MLDTVMALIRRSRMKTHKPFGNCSLDGLRLSLGDTNAEVAQALAAAFEDVHQVEVADIPRCAADLLVVEQAKEWLLGGQGT
jgi:hypothetical protein